MKKILSILIAIVLIQSIFSACANSTPNSKDTYANEMLLGAVEGGISQGVTEAIDNGANKDQLPEVCEDHTDHGTIERNPFRLACFNNKKNTAYALVEKGANPNALDAEGYPILSYVARCGSIDLCKLLLNHGANVNKTGKNGYTPLDAIFLNIGTTRPNDYLINEVYNLFLSKGSKVTPKTIEAMMDGHKDGYRNYSLDQKVLKRLITSGQKSGLSSALEASILGNSEKVTTLLKSNQIPKDDRQNVLFYTAAFGDVQTLKLLIKNGYNIKSKDELDDNLLAVASKAGNLNIMKYLMENGVDKNEQNADYYSPLRIAVAEDQYEAAKMLLSNGAKMTAENLLNNSPDVLWNAAWNGNTSMIKLLFQYGYPKTNTAVSLAEQSAAENNQTEPIKYLTGLGYAPDLEALDQTPLEVACEYGRMDAIQVLVASGADPDGASLMGQPLSAACISGETSAARYLIEKGANVNLVQKHSDGTCSSSALTEAVVSGSLDIVKLLIQHGANINYKDTNEGYALIVAADSGSKDVLEYLLQNGAKVNEQNFDGKTALIHAAANGDAEQVKSLLKYRADKNIKDKDGNTALSVSKSANESEINKLLNS